MKRQAPPTQKKQKEIGVCTHGNTLAMAAKAIRQRVGECEVIACTAGQVTVLEALAQPYKLLAKEP